jgi:hypothetical protein
MKDLGRQGSLPFGMLSRSLALVPKLSILHLRLPFSGKKAVMDIIHFIVLLIIARICGALG